LFCFYAYIVVDREVKMTDYMKFTYFITVIILAITGSENKQVSLYIV